MCDQISLQPPEMDGYGQMSLLMDEDGMICSIRSVCCHVRWMDMV